MKNNIFNFKKLFNNTQFLVVISLVLSVAIWISISLSDNNESSTIITNIPVNIQLSEETINNGYKIFSGTEQYATLTVTGNRVAIGNLTSEDVIVTAEGAGTITTTGTYPLSLTAKKANSTDNFEITSTISPSVITIYVDKADKKSFEIDNNITYNVAEGYHVTPSLSKKKVVISGPETEVSKIKKIAVEGNIGGTLKDTKKLDCEVKLYDYNDKAYFNNMISINNNLITAVFKVEPIKELPIKINYINKPDSLNIYQYLDMDISSVTVAGPKSILDNLEYISTETVDFSEFKNKKYTLDLKLEFDKKCTNLSEIPSVKAKFDFRDMKSKQVNVTKFIVENASDNYNYNITTESLNVKVIGDSQNLSNIKSSDLIGVIDGSTFDGKNGSVTLPIQVKVQNSNYCWVFGEYSANIIISENE